MTAAAIMVTLLLFVCVILVPGFFKMRENVYNMSCLQLRRNLETAAGAYDQQNTRTMARPGKTVDQDTLKEAGFIMKVQYCPKGGKYTFGANGKILCDLHSQLTVPTAADKPTSGATKTGSEQR